MHVLVTPYQLMVLGEILRSLLPERCLSEDLAKASYLRRLRF